MKKSPVVKRSIGIGTRKTSVSLEDAFWEGLREIATNRRTTIKSLITSIEAEHEGSNLSSALRLFVLDSYRNQILGIRSVGPVISSSISGQPAAPAAAD